MSVRPFTTTCTPRESAASLTPAMRAACSSVVRSSTALAVHGVLEVQADRPCAEQAVDELVGGCAVAGLEVGRDGKVHRPRDDGDQAQHLVEGQVLTVTASGGCGSRVAPHGEAEEALIGSDLRRPRVPDRREDDRVSGHVQGEQALGASGEI